MKIRRLHIKNLRLLEDLELDFTDERTGRPRNWTVIVAENGRGKSSVLQSIALAAAGRTLANSLGGAQLSSFFDRRRAENKQRPVEIGAEFDLPTLDRRALGFRKTPVRDCPGGQPDEDTLSSYLCLEPKQDTLVGQSWYGPLPQAWHGEKSQRPDPQIKDPLEQVRSKLRPWWFTVGYGIDRRLSTEVPKPSLAPSAQRLSSLLWPEIPTGIGFANRATYQNMASEFVKLLNTVLQRHPALMPMIRRLELRGQGGVTPAGIADKEKTEIAFPNGRRLKLPATELSHGYQSTLAWLADLVGQYLLDFERSATPFGQPDPSKLTGLVLIDELDLFLHPKWQIDFIEALEVTFPNLQFVATTHSPLLIGKLRPDQVVVLDWNEKGSIRSAPFDGDPRLMTATDLYRALFDIDDTPPDDELFGKVFRYETLARDPYRDDVEDSEMRGLRAELEALRLELRIKPADRAP